MEQRPEPVRLGTVVLVGALAALAVLHVVVQYLREERGPDAAHEPRATLTSSLPRFTHLRPLALVLLGRDGLRITAWLAVPVVLVFFCCARCVKNLGDTQPVPRCDGSIGRPRRSTPAPSP